MNKTIVDDTLISKRKEAYEEILRQEKGVRTELKISEALFDDFCRIGYIQQGMTGDWKETWKLTKFGKRQMLSFLNLVKQEERLNSIKTKLKSAIAEMTAIVA